MRREKARRARSNASLNPTAQMAALGSAFLLTAKVLVGKLPKLKPPKTNVWQIENN